MVLNTWWFTGMPNYNWLQSNLLLIITVAQADHDLHACDPGIEHHVLGLTKEARQEVPLLLLRKAVTIEVKVQVG